MKFSKSLREAAGEKYFQYVDYRILKKSISRSQKALDGALSQYVEVKDDEVSTSTDERIFTPVNPVGDSSIPMVSTTTPPKEVIAQGIYETFANNVEDERAKVSEQYEVLCKRLRDTLEQYQAQAKEMNNEKLVEVEQTLFRTTLFKFACSIDLHIEFSELNREGFRKICKKFDKNVVKTAREKYQVEMPSALESIYEAVILNEPFVLKEEGKTILDETANLYAHVFSENEEEVESIKAFFLEEVAKHQAYRHNPFDAGLKAYLDRARAVMPAEKIGLTKKGMVILPLALIISIVIPFLPLPFDDDQQDAQRALALLVLSLILWATSAIPLYATAILLIMMAVFLGIFGGDAEAASKVVYQDMVSDNTILVIIGFALNASLRRHHVDEPISRALTACSLGKPWLYLAVLMTLTLFLSTWLSNVAAPMLVISLVLPTIRSLPDKSKFGKAILMAICLSANIGGMGSPIASPQSAVALETASSTSLSFPGFMIVSFPICVILTIAAYAYVLIWFRPDIKTMPKAIDVEDGGPKAKTSIIGAAGTVITFLIAVLLWVSAPFTAQYIGKVGLVSLVPIFILFGLGLVSKQDFINLPWDVVALLAGGSVLGAAIKKTDLLSILIDPIEPVLNDLPGIVVIFLCGALMLVVGNLVSHTVAALIILPFVYELNKSYHPAMAVLLCGLIDSSAMMLPVSSFPNISTLSVEDAEKDKPFLKPKNLLFAGSVTGPLAYVVIFLIGVPICFILGY
ncbi:Citrate transporter [Carpediemonas membranifera]|uniref:Citrate transporter n=1 Tax=Carpediemonas membranifera TaxID=201153 RepID=A0A8J6BZB7_9EUKA|nr:Citrate transporter [Carpediemonas membranifera]|eukprot:KAG9395376.1 Citrate transporter [Carpediemonas membranifera]